MPVTSIHQSMRRRLIQKDGTKGSYLDDNHSALLEGTSWQDEQAAGTGTSGLTLMGSFSSPQVGQYVMNVTQDFMAQITAVASGELTLHYPLQTAGTNWGQADGTTSGKLVDSSASFTSTVTVGMIVALRDLSDHAVVTSVDSDSELSLSKDLFASGDKYTIMKGFKEGDTIKVGTAVLNGDDGHVMVEIPKFYYAHDFSSGKHRWTINPFNDTGLQIFPAFLRPDGTERDYIYVGAFEGVIDDYDFVGTQLTDYDLNNAQLGSFAGMRPVVEGQRSEFRQVAENNGNGWQIIDWYTNFAWQLLMMIEYEDMDSQTVVGEGLTTWGGTERDNWVDDTSNRAVIHTGASLRDGVNTVNRDTGAGNASGVLSYRGIENPYGNIWKFLDAINIYDGRVYIANDATGYTDDSNSSPYNDIGVSQPDNNGYISKVHPTRNGLLVAESSGSDSTYIPDYYYYNGGWRVVLAGGSVSHGVRAGFAALHASNSSSARFSSVGSRVCFRD